MAKGFGLKPGTPATAADWQNDIIALIVQNGVAGIWYNYTVGHSVSARRSLRVASNGGIKRTGFAQSG